MALHSSKRPFSHRSWEGTSLFNAVPPCSLSWLSQTSWFGILLCHFLCDFGQITQLSVPLLKNRNNNRTSLALLFCGIVRSILVDFCDVLRMMYTFLRVKLIK